MAAWLLAAWLLAAWPLAAWPLAAVLVPGTGRAAERDPCPGTETVATLRSVGEDGDVALDGGRRLRLVDLRFPAAIPASARIWLRSLAGSEITVTELGPADRWNRVPARLALAGRSPVDVAELMVGEGWALVDVGERDALCRPDLLRAEAGARRRRAGLWAGGSLPVAGDDDRALRAADGAFVVAEGRIASIGERRAWTYLNFGRDWSRTLTLAIPVRTWSALKARGLTAAALRGKSVRVRGLVEVRRGPTVELAAPDLLELVE